MEPPKIASVQAARLMHEGALTLSDMERHGIRIDMGYLKEHTEYTEKEIADLKRRLYADEIWSLWERKFGNKATLGNKVQLGMIVFDDMGFKRRHTLAKRDKSNEEGNYRRTPKNDEASFGNAAQELPFVKDYFRWQKLEKLYGTYLKGIMTEVVDGRIHPFFHLHKVLSYRSSSSNINFTNIPNRHKEIAKRIRRCFIPDKGCWLVEMDYSGAEVRSACCYTHDPRLIEEFTGKGKDPHGDTARELFGITRELTEAPESFCQKQREACRLAWEKGPRDWSKNRFVFPQFFGSVYFQCAPHLWEGVESGHMMPHGDMTVQEYLALQGITELGDCSEGGRPEPGTFTHRVKVVEDGFWNQRFQVYTAWKKRWYNNYLMKGWFESLSGFVYSGMYDRNVVLNLAIQGFAFHWLLQSCIYKVQEIRKLKMLARLCGQIHDCSLANVPEREVQDYIHMAVQIMTKRIPQKWPSIIVPLACAVECCPEGTSWADKQVYKEVGGRWQAA